MKLGILGAGGIASTMAKTVAGMKGVEAYAVAARDLERAREFAQKYEVKKAYGSYEEMLADDEVGLVYISNSSFTPLSACENVSGSRESMCFVKRHLL